MQTAFSGALGGCTGALACSKDEGQKGGGCHVGEGSEGAGQGVGKRGEVFIQGATSFDCRFKTASLAANLEAVCPHQERCWQEGEAPSPGLGPRGRSPLEKLQGREETGPSTDL